ncbi:MAG: Hpt domain-containing protein [Treponema sp.]|nr:Hpt domain-containing protein [Treponema sp.]
MPTIDTAHGMEYSMNDKDMYKDMVSMFIEQREQNLSDIQGAFDKKDWDNYRIKVHGLKSNSRLVGGMELGDLAEKCEHAARDKDEALIVSETPKLFELYEQTIQALGAIDYNSL